MRSNLDKMNNLTQRILVAIFGIVILISAVIYSQWTYFIVMALITLISILEFYKLTGLDGMLPLKFWGAFSAILLVSISFLSEAKILHPKYYYIILPVATSIFFIKLYKKKDAKPFTNIAYTFLGILYIGVPFSLLNIIAFHFGGYSYQIILGMLLLIWASDTGAYFAGSKFGKTKLFFRVSPKKSWEGFIGGAILALGVAFALSQFFHILPVWKWLVIGGITIIAGTYGDLVESLFKRSIEIKDSGKILPGHGGFLDRFDGLLLSIPFIIAFLKLS